MYMEKNFGDTRKPTTNSGISIKFEEGSWLEKNN